MAVLLLSHKSRNFNRSNKTSPSAYRTKESVSFAFNRPQSRHLARGRRRGCHRRHLFAPGPCEDAFVAFERIAASAALLEDIRHRAEGAVALRAAVSVDLRIAAEAALGIVALN